MSSKNQVIDISIESDEADSDRSQEETPEPVGNLWRAGLIVLSSIALGGLALAIWNRKGIDSMHRSREETNSWAGSGRATDSSRDHNNE